MIMTSDVMQDVAYAPLQNGAVDPTRLLPNMPEKCNYGALEEADAYGFCCPITMTPMVLPVCLYDAEQPSNNRGGNKDPKTNIPLREPRLLYNWNLKAAIQDWAKKWNYQLPTAPSMEDANLALASLTAQPQQGPRHTETEGSTGGPQQMAGRSLLQPVEVEELMWLENMHQRSAATPVPTAQDLRTLAQLLASGTGITRDLASRCLRELTYAAGGDNGLLRFGPLAPLVALLDSDLPCVAEEAANGLAQLADAAEILVFLANSGPRQLVELLQSGVFGLRLAAARAVEQVVKSGPDGRVWLVQRRVIPPLVELLRPGQDIHLQEAGAIALGLLGAQERGTQMQLKEAGAARLLVQLLGSEAPDVQYAAATTMGSLAEDIQNYPIAHNISTDMINAGAVSLLTQHLQGDSEEMQTVALSTLVKLVRLGSTSSVVVRSEMEVFGAFAAVVQLMRVGTPSLQLHTLWAVSSLGDDGAFARSFVIAGVARALLDLMEAGRVPRQAVLCALETIARQSYGAQALSEAGAPFRLARRMRAETPEARVKTKLALQVLNELPASEQAILAAGAVAPLIRLLKSGARTAQAAAAAMVCRIAGCEQGQRTLKEVGAGGVRERLLASGHSNAECAASARLALCLLCPRDS